MDVFPGFIAIFDIQNKKCDSTPHVLVFWSINNNSLVYIKATLHLLLFVVKIVLNKCHSVTL